jgi:TolB-like protein
MSVRRKHSVSLRLAAVFPALLAGVLGVSRELCAQATTTQKATLAIMEFDVSAMTRPADYAQLGSGIQVILTNAVATNPSLVLLERQKIESLLKEQNLVTTGRVDAETAVKVGKLLGAQHVLLGQLVVQSDKEMRLLVRSVNVETSVIEWTDDVRSKGDKVFDMVDALAVRINSGLKLPGVRSAKAVKDVGLSGPNQLEAARAFAAAQRLQERGDTKGAIAMYQKAVSLNGEFTLAKTHLALLDRAAPMQD